jgi:hypothetical protein
MGALALFLVLTGGSAYALSGHNTVFSDDIVNGQVKRADLAPPDAWHEVGAGSISTNLCIDPSNTAVFCSLNGLSGFTPWHNYGDGYPTAAFYKDQLGIVRMKGLVSAGFINEQTNPVAREIFRLPAAYRPASQRIFSIVGDNTDGQAVAQGRVDVQADGLVILTHDCSPSYVQCSASGGYVPLDGISFRPDE